MSGQSPSAPQQPPANTKGLTPVQIGAGVGAALTVLILFGIRDLWPQGEGGNLSNLLIGVLGGVGAMLGMAVVSLANFLRHRKRQEGVQDGVTGKKIGAAVQSAPAPGGQRERNGNPILRVAAGLVALMFAGILPLTITQGKLNWDGGVFMALLAVVFGWYAAPGNEGLPEFLSRKRGTVPVPVPRTFSGDDAPAK
jgi:hypothetical protein